MAGHHNRFVYFDDGWCAVTRRIAIVLAVVVVLGSGFAFVSGCGSQAASSNSTTGDPQAAVGNTGSATGASTADSLVLDPAKEEPVLDKFTSKDPFFDNNISTPSVKSSATSSASPSPTPSSATSHSITLTQIGSDKSSEIGATLVVDGKTYSNKVIGKIFSTTWGQMKVVSIDLGAHTVTILHGDELLTLQEGQTITR
jgi:hypothetical protein